MPAFASTLVREAKSHTPTAVGLGLMTLSTEPRDPSGPSGPSELGDESFKLDQHFTHIEVEALCSKGTLLDAMLAVVSRFTPLCRYWHRGGGYANQAYIVFARGDDRWAKIRVAASDTLRWSDADGAHEHPYTVLYRRALLQEVLERAKTFDHINRRVAKPFTPLTVEPVSKRADRELARASLIAEYNGVVGLWWDIRLAEGCTPEAARMLLGLIVPVETLQRLDFPTDPSADLSPYLLYNGSCPFTPPVDSSA